MRDLLANASISFCFANREDCETVAVHMTKQLDLSAKPYHAGLTKKQRARIEERWLAGCFVLICTVSNEFDIPIANARCVFHNFAPKSIEVYYREAGKHSFNLIGPIWKVRVLKLRLGLFVYCFSGCAGRDGEQAVCCLFYTWPDIKILLKEIDEDENSTPETKKVNKEHLFDVAYYCSNNVECRRVQVMRHFGEVASACAKSSVMPSDFLRNLLHRFCDSCARCVS